MSKILLSFLLSFLFANYGFANSLCYQQVSSKIKPEGNYKQQEVINFIKEHRVLPPEIIEGIKNRASLYSLRGEDMGNAILVHAFAILGPNVSRHRDLLVNKFLKPIFDYYQKEFESFSTKFPPGIIHRIPNQFGLSKIGFTADSYGFIHWNKESSNKFNLIMKNEFSKKQGFDLVRANRLLIQMSLIHSILSGQSKMTLSEIKRASDDYFYAESKGHLFIPIVGEWDLPNIIAQWHLNATVNMLPKILSKNTDVHGGDGLTALEGITHDHGHVVRWRKGVVASSFGFKRLEKVLDIELIAQEGKIRTAFDRALAANLKNSSLKIDQEVLTHILFFFVHQPEPLGRFLKDTHAFKSEDQASQLAQLMYDHYVLNQNFYPMIKAKKEVFIETSLYWIQLLANQM